MNTMFDTEGTVTFPLQEELAFVFAFCSAPAKNIFTHGCGHFCEKRYWTSCLCFALLACYASLIGAVIFVVVPWFKALIVAKFAVSSCWAWPVKQGMLWGIGKMVTAINRKIALYR